MLKNKLIVIVGPTASGKSALGVELARKFSGEIISADSRQVYRGLNIGTGKITKRQMRGVPHHLLDVASPSRKFSAADFVKKASGAYVLIHHKGTSIVSKGSSPKKNWSRANKNMVFMVGGTGYYVDSFVGRINVPDVPPNAKLRETLDVLTTAQLFARLKKADPQRAEKMDTPSERGNKRRLIRALEIATSGVRIINDLRGRYDVLWIGIRPSLEELEKKIHTRLIARIKKGMVREAQQLHKEGLSYKRMEELGLEYRSLARFLQKKITKLEMIDELERDIRRYAKKQLMYWKRNPEIKWFKPTQKAAIASAVRKWLRNSP